VMFLSLFRISAVIEPIDETIKVRTRLKRWAAANGYTLTFLSAMFLVTWALEIARLITGR
jgi:hypothetical protein